MSVESPKGRVFTGVSPHMPDATFSIVSSKGSKEIGEGLYQAEEAGTVYVGESSLGDLFIGIGIIRSEQAKGNDVFIIHSENDEISLPDGICDEEP